MKKEVLLIVLIFCCFTSVAKSQEIFRQGDLTFQYPSGVKTTTKNNDGHIMVGLETSDKKIVVTRAGVYLPKDMPEAEAALIAGFRRGVVQENLKVVEQKVTTTVGGKKANGVKFIVEEHGVVMEVYSLTLNNRLVGVAYCYFLKDDDRKMWDYIRESIRILTVEQ